MGNVCKHSKFPKSSANYQILAHPSSSSRGAINIFYEKLFCFPLRWDRRILQSLFQENTNCWDDLVSSINELLLKLISPHWKALHSQIYSATQSPFEYTIWAAPNGMLSLLACFSELLLVVSPYKILFFYMFTVPQTWMSVRVSGLFHSEKQYFCI